jgi:hypothetical protein
LNEAAPGARTSSGLNSPTPSHRATLRGLAGSRRAKIAFLALIAAAVVIEQVVFTIADMSSAHHTSQPARVAQPRTLRGKLNLALYQALGGSDRGVRRFRVLSIGSGRTANRYKTVTVRWSINNDLSAGTLGDAAEADVYLILSHIFSLHEPIGRVNLVGTYPMDTHRGEQPVVRVWMDRKTANVIGQGGWGTVDAQTVWPLVHRVYVNPDFVPVDGQ